MPDQPRAFVSSLPIRRQVQENDQINNFNPFSRAALWIPRSCAYSGSRPSIIPPKHAKSLDKQPRVVTQPQTQISKQQKKKRGRNNTTCARALMCVLHIPLRRPRQRFSQQLKRKPNMCDRFHPNSAKRIYCSIATLLADRPRRERVLLLPPPRPCE
jgi:hypothetical protein